MATRWGHLVSYSLRQQMSLEGRVAVIKGGANIAGPQLAAAMAELGAQLALVDIDGEGCDRIAWEVRESYGTDAVGFVTDVANEQAVSAMSGSNARAPAPSWPEIWMAFLGMWRGVTWPPSQLSPDDFE